jgi:transposase
MSAAVCFSPDRTDATMVFGLRPGSYNDVALIEFLTELHDHLGGDKVTLIWDGLPSHRSRAMRRFIATQRHWLVVEPLPPYAYDLNPVEQVWGNLKGTELANLCPDTIDEAADIVDQGFCRIGSEARLCFAFLRHCGLSLGRRSCAVFGEGLLVRALLDGEESSLQILGDGAYGDGATLASLREGGHRAAIKPWPTANNGLFGRDDFVVDQAAGTVTCPGGATVTITPGRAAVFGIHCQGCPLREQCTRAKNGRTLHLNPHDDELVESRHAWREGDFAEDYRRWRPMVERSIAWLVADNHRRVRFKGVERNRLGLSLRVAAINLRRLINLGLDHEGRWTLTL